MNTTTQNHIINILGTIAIIGEIGIFTLLLTQHPDLTIIAALISFIAGITGGLIGFLTGKTLTEHQEETIDTMVITDVQPEQEPDTTNRNNTEKQ
jgi:putative flippase GtrA